MHRVIFLKSVSENIGTRHCFSKLVLLIICTIFFCGQASAFTTQTVTFDEYPLETVITDQYRDLGVIFSGVPNNQKVHIPYPIFGQNLSPALLTSYTVDGYGSPYGAGNLTVSFVIPGTNISAPANYYRFQTYYYAFPSQDHIFTFYPIDSEPIVKTWWEIFNMGEWPTVPVTKIVMEPAQGVNDTLLWLENFSFRILCTGTDADGDGHYTTTSCLVPNDDCDDTDPTVPSTEICGDGKDNDCDSNIDCKDSECTTNQECFTRKCSPSKGIPSPSISE